MPSIELPEALETWLLSSLKGNFAPFPGDSSDNDLTRLAQYTDDSGIQTYLRYKLNATGALKTCPPFLQQTFERRHLMEVITHSLRKKELLSLVDAFHDADVRMLLLKGAALSYLIYPEPSLRTCCDIDVLVRPSKVAAADRLLKSLGYELERRHSFELTYVKKEQGIDHVIDLHWRISESTVFSVKYDFNEVDKRSISIHALSPKARTLGTVDTLINACIHMAHHGAWDRLIWLTDVYLLFDRLTDEQIHELVNRAVDKKCGPECVEALRITQNIYGIELDHPAIKRLLSLEPDGYRKGHTRHSEQDENNSVSEFFNLIRETPRIKRFNVLWTAMFPPLVDISVRYDTQNKLKIPFIYLYRLLIKIPKILIFNRWGKSAQ